ERRTILHRDGIGLLATSASDGTPLKEAIDRHDATPHSISLPEHRKPHNALSLGVDGSPAGVLAPMWDNPPLDKIKGAFAGLVVLPNDKQFLARRSVVARGDVAHAAIADIQALHNGEAKRPRALDHTSTHAGRYLGAVDRISTCALHGALTFAVLS